MATTTNTTQLVVIALAALAVLVFLPTLFMGGGMMGYGGGMMGPMYGTDAPGWMLFVGALGQLLMLALLVGLGYLGYKALTNTGGRADTAMEELRAAYARGDIDDDEFDRRKERLQDET
ncbi:putative membrane protein [Halogranum gelatinilyticum]|uniref:Putative membrane protein n=1 Tax=Halogranum gelatinilyticum TaxID=660521 RepID=A0A1G9PQP5_9EURY|nr:SHOCT domain-containing protein [Halogranum gelatinilyticum]SDM00943.1 putative membrane protein [Halogranum gelatinilyticum]